MNFIGKIFVVLITVMSLAFMSFAVAVYATHRNWRDIVLNELRPQLDEARAENQSLRDTLERLTNDLQSEQTNRRTQVAKLEQEKELLQRERDERQRETAELVEERRRSIAAMEATQRTLENLRAEVDRLREEIVQAQQDRDDHFKRMVALTDEVQQLEGRRNLLEARNMQLLEQVARQNAVLDRHGLDEFMPIDGIPPKVDGIILAVGDRGLVEISIGSDDGLRTGHTLEVFRHGTSNSKYLGRVEVVRIEADRAVAKVIPEFRKGIIQKEDRVASRLN